MPRSTRLFERGNDSSVSEVVQVELFPGWAAQYRPSRGIHIRFAQTTEDADERFDHRHELCATLSFWPCSVGMPDGLTDKNLFAVVIPQHTPRASPGRNSTKTSTPLPRMPSSHRLFLEPP